MTHAQILYLIIATPAVVGMLAVYWRECLHPRS